MTFPDNDTNLNEARVRRVCGSSAAGPALAARIDRRVSRRGDVATCKNGSRYTPSVVHFYFPRHGLHRAAPLSAFDFDPLRTGAPCFYGAGHVSAGCADDGVPLCKISIPAAGNGILGEATFHFNISNNAEMEGPQGSFECVRSGGARRLESCGPLPRRMRVLANDDSYEATKDRMARTVAAEQSKCTRVIKPNQTDIGRRVKVRSSHPLNSLSTSSAQVPRPAPHSQHPVHQHPQAHPPPQPQPQSQPHVNSTGPVQAPGQQQPAIRPPPGNPDLARRPIKERLIQLLALKPFKKPELYSRLNSEGIKEKERSVINTILQQISSLKDNCYHLHRHIWNDVNEDWPFYSEEEKRMLKRRKPQNLTPPLSSDSTNSLSPRASPGGKRSGAGTGEEVPASKKQRISHYQQRPAPTGSPSSGYATGGSGASSGERQVSDNEDETSAPARSVKKDNGYTLSFGVNTVKDLCSSPVKGNGFSRSSPPVEQTNVTENNITNNEPLENTELTSAPDENNMTDLDEIERQYPPITSSSVRRAYKNEFSELYNEYRELYNSVAAVADVFTRLEQQLKRAHPHSPHHQSIEQRIVEEYRKVRNDAAYQRRRRRVNYLHRKLTHIKRMVHEYDQLRNLKPERVSAASTTQAY